MATDPRRAPPEPAMLGGCPHCGTRYPAVDHYYTCGGMRPASWVIRERTTGRIIMETFNEHLISKMLPEYDAVPIGKYLESLNHE